MTRLRPSGFGGLARLVIRPSGFGGLARLAITIIEITGLVSFLASAAFIGGFVL